MSEKTAKDHIEKATHWTKHKDFHEIEKRAWADTHAQIAQAIALNQIAGIFERILEHVQNDIS